MADAAASSLFVRSEHEQKFDRQTRIWGAHGQRAIETARVCVLGGNATSSEALKNLVLPNVGHFTVVDAAPVTADDVGNNFFVSGPALGQPRAEVVTAELLEMNPDVSGAAVLRDPLEVIASDLAFFDGFHLVVATQLPEEPLLRLAGHLYSRGVPLVSSFCYGLVGQVRLAVPVLEIVETHYENDRHDLCLHPRRFDAFPELAEYCASFDLGTEDSGDHAHIPYVAILAEMLRRWREAHGGEMPRTFDDKTAFRRTIVDAAREFGKEENFQEAEKFAARAYLLPELDWQVQAVLDHPRCAELTAESSNFWVLARAVREFIAAEGGGFPPVSAGIPDMTCRTGAYIRLKAVYEARSRRDVAAVAAHARRLLESVGRPALPDAEVAYFCANFAGIASVEVRSLASERDPAAFPADDVNEDWLCGPDPGETEEENRPRDLHWYFALRAVRRFHQRHGRWPGDADEHCKADAAEVGRLQAELHKELGVRAEPWAACAGELVRFGPSEPHNVAALLGGIIAQVALKVILRQFVPLNNTCVYNGVHARQSVYTL